MSKELDGIQELKDNTKVRNIVYVCPIDHDGNTVFIKGWIPETSEYPPLLLLHELGDSLEQIVPLAQLLADNGFRVYGFSLRGHGISVKKTGSALDFNQLVLDLLQVVSWVKHKENGLTPILFAQGLISLLPIFLVKNYSNMLSGLILHVPAFIFQEPIKPYERVIIRTLAEVLPTMRLPKMFQHLLNIQEIKEKLRAKGNVKITTSFASDLLSALSQGRKIFPKISFPTLVLIDSYCQDGKVELLKKFINRQPEPKQFHLATLENLEEDKRMMIDQEGALPQIIVNWVNENRAHF